MLVDVDESPNHIPLERAKLPCKIPDVVLTDIEYRLQKLEESMFQNLRFFITCFASTSVHAGGLLSRFVGGSAWVVIAKPLKIQYKADVMRVSLG